MGLQVDGAIRRGGMVIGASGSDLIQELDRRLLVSIAEAERLFDRW